MSWSRSGLKLMAVAALAATVSNAALALPTQDDDIDAAVQTLADLTLIDGQCRDLSVNFGIGFTFASEHGVGPAAVMPTGAMRRMFERDLDRSAAAYTAEITCGALAEHYSTAVPGSVTFPLGDRRAGGG